MYRLSIVLAILLFVNNASNCFFVIDKVVSGSWELVYVENDGKKVDILAAKGITKLLINIGKVDDKYSAVMTLYIDGKRVEIPDSYTQFAKGSAKFDMHISYYWLSGIYKIVDGHIVACFVLWDPKQQNGERPDKYATVGNKYAYIVKLRRITDVSGRK